MLENLSGPGKLLASNADHIEPIGLEALSPNNDFKLYLKLYHLNF